MQLLRRASTAAALLVGALASDVVATDDSQRGGGGGDCNNSYTKMSKSTYGFDDGGCYMCTEQHGPDAQLPLAGTALSEHCRRMCDADTSCVSYTIARTANLPAQDYWFGSRANCCLERRHYPPGAFVEVARGAMPITSCERDAACWNRYEKTAGRESKVKAEETCATAPQKTAPSPLCTMAWEPIVYTDAEVREKMDFIARGCESKDATFEGLLAAAAERCQEEAFAESVTVNIISHPKALYMRATIIDT